MNIATWRTAACLTLLGLAACKSSAREQPASAPIARETASPGAPGAPGSPGSPGAPAAAPAATMAKAAVGQSAPDFTLTDLDGKSHRLADYRGKIVVLEWFSPTCPYCVHAYTEGPLVDQPERLAKDGVVWLSVNSSNPSHPGSKADRNKAFVDKHGLEAPILMDPSGVVGRAYGAKTTPHCFVIDAKGVLVYAGGLDNAPAGKVDGDAPPVNHVDAAVADVRAGRPVATSSTRAYG